MVRNKLLAIPNDPISAYHRSDQDDFLSEFNPICSGSGNRFFDSVAFLNWKDKVDGEFCGVASYSFLENKEEAYGLLSRLASGEIPFRNPLFEPIFLKEKKRLLDVSKNYNPNIVRAFNTHFAAELGYVVAKELGVPLIVSAHDPLRLTEAVKYADSLVSISENMAETCVDRYGINRDNIVVIPDGIDTKNLFLPKSKFEYSSVVGERYNGDHKILSVGRIVSSKNIETLLKAVKEVGADFPDLKHIHLGKGSDEAVSNIENMRDSLGLNGSSFFLGGVQKSKLPFYYSWASVYALPTFYEGLGRAQIEALSCGTPVITTNDAPMNTVVKNGENGFLVDPNNYLELADAIKKSFINNSLMTRLRNNARGSVERFDIDVVMDANCRNYRRILDS